MKGVQILDCTLRDGGRIIDCDFGDQTIIGIGRQLLKAKIDIVELGFLRDISEYKNGSTFFSSCEDADQYIEKINVNSKDKSNYVLFVDYGLYDITRLCNAKETNIKGIRYGFTKKNFEENKEDLLRETKLIKDLGFDLYVQDVNTNGYSKEELSEVIKFVNEIKPCSFGIVDTYGSMYLDEFVEIWKQVDCELMKTVAIDFHSHNNQQMSFALAQMAISLANNCRKLIIDATLLGMGKCAGNLNTELIIDYLARKMSSDYNENALLDAIDRYVSPYKYENEWGYSVPAFMAGIYRAHPNNVIYLTSKYRLNNRDIKYILSGIDELKRQRYDYDNIAKIYKEYCDNAIDDTDTLDKLEDTFANKNVLVIAPGYSVEKYINDVNAFIAHNDVIVISINYCPGKFQSDYFFFANTIHWETWMEDVDASRCILTSNIHEKKKEVNFVDYSGLIVEDNKFGDNSTILLLNLLKQLSVKKIYIAGFDGFSDTEKNYVDGLQPNMKIDASTSEINSEIKKMFEQYKNKVSGKIELSFITPSIYMD